MLDLREIKRPLHFTEDGNPIVERDCFTFLDDHHIQWFSLQVACARCSQNTRRICRHSGVNHEVVVNAQGFELFCIELPLVCGYVFSEGPVGVYAPPGVHYDWRG